MLLGVLYKGKGKQLWCCLSAPQSRWWMSRLIIEPGSLVIKII